MPTTRASTFRRAASQATAERREVTRKEAEAIPPPPFLDWAVRIPEPKAGPLDFDRFPFQRELYEETGMVGELVVMKATQIGISAYLVRETMYWADVKGWTVIYVFPKLGLMYDFADARVRPLIQGSKYLSGRVPRAHVQNKGLRQIGAGFVFYRGSESVDGLESIDADALALDEYDNLVAANVPIVERRLSGSQHGLIRRVGVPSVPGFGLDALYEKSDQRRWHVKCAHCRKWMPVFMYESGHDDFPLVAYVDQEEHQVVCGKCRKPLDVAEGEWVPAFPDREVRGYHASRLIVPAVARNDRGMLTGIIKASLSPEPYEIQVHHNRDLGEAFAPSEGRLSLEALRAAQRDDLFQQTGYVGDNLVTAGIDVASVRALNMRISEYTKQGHKRALWIGQCEDFNEVEARLKEFNVHMFVIDHLPEGRMARGLLERFPGRGYLCVLTGSATQKVLSVNEETTTVTVRRTEAIDGMMAMIRQQRNLLPADLPEGYAKQMQAPVRYLEKDDVGKVIVGYRSSGPDDYAMSEVFDVVASDVWVYRQQFESLTEGEITALEDRLEFERSHLSAPEAFRFFNPGPGEVDGGYSPGFSAPEGEGEDEPGHDDPWSAWPDE